MNKSYEEISQDAASYAISKDARQPAIGKIQSRSIFGSVLKLMSFAGIGWSIGVEFETWKLFVFMVSALILFSVLEDAIEERNGAKE